MVERLVRVLALPRDEAVRGGGLSFGDRQVVEVESV
jgi:hypothetical protein